MLTGSVRGHVCRQTQPFHSTAEKVSVEKGHIQSKREADTSGVGRIAAPF